MAPSVLPKRVSTPVHRAGNELPSSPSSAASVGLTHRPDGSLSPSTSSLRDDNRNGNLITTVSPHSLQVEEQRIYLELKDGTVHEGLSFGAPKSAAGELVFQTGMVGYPESVTDPSYRGQILVITFPLIGNYGVPSRDDMDEVLGNLPKHFEASEIHIAGLVVAAYCGEEYSHFLATSSLGAWLKESGVPAMYGVDTRALAKRIREEGSMLGRMLHQSKKLSNGNKTPNGIETLSYTSWRDDVETIEWIDPNTMNLVQEGEIDSLGGVGDTAGSDDFSSLDQRATPHVATTIHRITSSFRPPNACSVRRCGFKVQSTTMPAITWC